jgi:hypothetical protein
MSVTERITAIVVCAGLLVIAGIAPGRGHASAQVRPGTIYARFPSADAALQGRPIMVSAIRGGEVVKQQETVLPSSQELSDLPPGLYDVRAEGQGAVTEVKRGVHVFAGQELDVNFVMRSGTGVRTVEYAAAGLSREEVAARLAKLEAAVAALQKAAAPRP